MLGTNDVETMLYYNLVYRAVVEVLLAGGMNVNARTSSGTALHEAAMCGKTEVVRTLLKNGIDLNIRDVQNNTVEDVLKQFPCHVVHDIYSLIKSKSNSRIADRKSGRIFMFLSGLLQNIEQCITNIMISSKLPS